MKQSLKFGLLLVLALLIHCATNGAMEDMCKVSSPTYRQEKCYVSQDRPIQDALERLYNLYTTQTCDMSHTDVAHVPTDKSMFLLIAYFCDHYKHQSPPYPVSSHSPTYYYDPISYYISVSYTHLRAHETDSYLVCRLLLEKKKIYIMTYVTQVRNTVY